jgi:hypothetical protein
MPTKTTLTREQIEAQAADINTKLAAFHAEDQRQAEEQEQRRHAAQRQFDEQLVESTSVAHLNANVEQARADLDAALADNPLVQALSGYLTALRRRSNLLFEVNSARNRLGQPATSRPSGMTTEVTGAEIVDFIAQAVARVATDRVGAEMAELHARRDAAGTEG